MSKTAVKQTTVIATRDFLRNFSSIIQKPKSKEYVIIKHGKPVATLTPHPSPDTTDEWWKGLEHQEPVQTKKKRITLKDLEKHRFYSGEKHLSQRVDEIVYGIKR